jgi:hypothetical protein
MTDFPPPQPHPPPIPPGQRTVSYLNWRVTTTLLAVVVVAAVGCVIADVLIWALTFASPSVTMPDWVFAPFFAFAILGNLVVVGLIAAAHGTKSARRLTQLRHLPKWVIGGLVLIAAVFFVTGLATFSSNSLPGQPGYNASTKQYYFDDHGDVIPTDRAHYLNGVAHQTRLFISGAALFTSVALLLGSAELARRRSVDVPRLRDVPRQPPPLPRWCPAAVAGIGLAVVGLVVGGAAFSQIVRQVDSYLSAGPAVTTVGTTEHLTAGPWVVFTWCETHATDPQYGCAQLSPSDIIIQDQSSGAIIGTAPDPSTDHISPDELPAVGQLVFSVPKSGNYSLRLTREVPKGVFVNKSPGSVAHSLIGVIALTVLGLALLIGGLVLYIRRVGWRLRLAPRVIVQGPTS